MDIRLFLVFALIIISVLMYGFSILWYFYISKKRGVYIVEFLASTISLILIILLYSAGNNASDMGNAIAAIFGIAFLVPLFISGIITAVLVKITTVFLEEKEETNERKI